MPLAITRVVSRSMAECELSHVAREPIDIQLARAQHLAYEHALERQGFTIERLAEAPSLPDSVFVEDAAVVVDEAAVITRPGAASRRPETAAVAEALRRHRTLHVIEAPGTLDGGDVLRVGHAVWVGRSRRTNDEGIAQLRGCLAPLGYDVRAVDVTACLHLKSAVTQVGPALLLLNPDWVDAGAFGALEHVAIDPAEPFGANALLAGPVVIYPDSFPRTATRLEAAGVTVHRVGVSEMARAEGGVTCCSLLLWP